MKKLRTFLMLALAVAWLSACHQAAPDLPATGKDTLLVFIMAGQSNMAGRGQIGPEDTNSNPRILVLDSTGQLVVASEPLHHDFPSRQGLDCGLSFAQHLLPALPSNVRIALLPYAVGSSSVEQWLGDSLRGIHHIYSAMLKGAYTACQRGTLTALLWFQGEQNADDTTSRHYGEKLAALFSKMRSDLAMPTMPVLTGKLPAFMHMPYCDSVNAGIGQVASSVAAVYLVPTDDLGCNPDSVHFDATAQRLLGQRFARIARMVCR